MNHGHQKSAETLTLRLNSLHRLDVWFPLVLEESGDPGVLYIWDAVSLHLADLKGIVTAHDWWIYPIGKTRRWDQIVVRWGLARTPLLETHHDKKWINFHGESKNDISPFSRGVSNTRLPSMFTIPSPKHTQGFSFTLKKKSPSTGDISSQNRTRMHDELDRESTRTPIATTESTPTSTSLVSGDERSETKVSIFDERTLSAVLSGSLILSHEDKKRLDELLLSQAIAVKGGQ